MNNISIKFSKMSLNFLNNARINRIKVSGKELRSYNETLELIVKYFKENNDEYLQMLNTKMENEK